MFYYDFFCQYYKNNNIIYTVHFTVARILVCSYSIIKKKVLIIIIGILNYLFVDLNLLVTNIRKELTCNNI